MPGLNVVEVGVHGMTRFVVEFESALPPEELWRKLWELSRHSTAVPFTKVNSDDGSALRAGSHFVARTALGPLRFDDHMLVNRWQPPNYAVIIKTGPVLTGTIHASIEAVGTGSRLHWEQDFSIRGVPDVLATLVRKPVAVGYSRVLRRITG